MRNTLEFHWTFVVALLAFPVLASAQQTTDDKDPVALSNPVISSDGAWMAAEERSDRSDVNVRVWSTQRDTTFTIERGQNPRFSRDSRWVSALQQPLAETNTDEPKNQRAGQTLVLLDLKEGTQRTFDFVLSYDVTWFSSHLVYLQSPAATADEERKGGTLRVVELGAGDRVFTWQNVTQYAAHQSTNHDASETWKESYAYVAFVTSNEETGHDRLEIAFVGHDKKGWGTGGTHDGEKIEGLSWAHDSITLGFIDSTEATDKNGKPSVTSAPYTWHDMRGRSSHREFTRVDGGDSKFSALHNLVISADGAWVAAEESSDQSDGNVRMWSTERELTFTIERGQNPRISRDSRWVSALQKPLEDSRTAQPKNKRAGQTLVLLDMQDGSRRTFDLVLSHDWTYSHDKTCTSMHLVYFQSPETKADGEGPSKDEATKRAKKPAAKQRKVGLLHLVHLKGDGVDRVKQNVTQYAADPTSCRVASVVHNEETGRDRLHIEAYSARHSGMNGMYDGEKIKGLCWARDRPMLGFLDSTETTGKDGKRRTSSALYTWQISGKGPWEKFTRVDTPQ